MNVKDCRFIAEREKSGKAVYFRKLFCVKDGVACVKVCLSAIGVAKGYLNGAEFDCDCLTPGWTDYKKRVPYYTFDVTNQIVVGENALGFMLGDGWACGKIGWFGKNHYSEKPYLWYFVEICYQDGTRESFGSDRTTQYGYGAIGENDMQDGVFIDDNAAVNFACVGESEIQAYAEEHDSWHEKLEKAVAPLTKGKEVFLGKKVGEYAGEPVYDFGQNHAGVPKIYLKNAKKGDRLTVKYGEILDGTGEVYTENLRSAKCIDTFVCREGSTLFAPTFTFHGYRYLSVKIEGSAELERVESVALYSDLSVCGSFACSDENVNQLYSNICWGQKSNFLNVPTDCPQRDERLGWSGDCQVFCATAMYNMDCRTFFKKHLQDVRDAQLPNGMIEVFAPCVKSNCDQFDGVAAWGDEITILPYQYYLCYKDKSVIEENLSAAKGWIEFCLQNSDGYIRPNKGYSDWLSVDDDMDQRVLGTLFFAYSALLTSKMCHVVKDGDESKYFALYQAICKAFCEKFVDEKGVILSDTQTCYLLAYAFGVRKKEQVLSHLLNALQRKGNRLSTGFIGVRYLLPVLCELGESELAYSLLTSTEYPSWCYSVVNGATTMWERWNSYSHEFGLADRRMNSFNHYSLGSVGEWMFAYMLGIRFEEGGVKISPTVDKSGKITWARGSYTLDGKQISVQWNRLDTGEFELKIQAPEEVEIDLSGYRVLSCEQGRYIIE